MFGFNMSLLGQSIYLTPTAVTHSCTPPKNVYLISVLRDVVWAERWDAQADGDSQEIECHHCPAVALFVSRGSSYIFISLTKDFTLQKMKHSYMYKISG